MTYEKLQQEIQSLLDKGFKLKDAGCTYPLFEDVCKEAVKNCSIGERLMLESGGRSLIYDIYVLVEGHKLFLGTFDEDYCSEESPVKVTLRASAIHGKDDVMVVLLGFLQSSIARQLEEEEERAEDARKSLASAERGAADLRSHMERLRNKRFVMKQIGFEMCRDMPDAFFAHTYRAMTDYGLSVYDSDKWAWLNTLMGFDIGFYHARDIIGWYAERDRDVMDICVGCRKEFQDIVKNELGFHFDFSKFPEKTPEAISYEWPDRI